MHSVSVPKYGQWQQLPPFPLQSNLRLAFEVGLFEKESILIVKVLKIFFARTMSTILLGQVACLWPPHLMMLPLVHICKILHVLNYDSSNILHA